MQTSIENFSNHSTIKIDDDRDIEIDREKKKKQTLSQFLFFNSSETYLWWITSSVMCTCQCLMFVFVILFGRICKLSPWHLTLSQCFFFSFFRLILFQFACDDVRCLFYSSMNSNKIVQNCEWFVFVAVVVVVDVPFLVFLR